MRLSTLSVTLLASAALLSGCGSSKSSNSASTAAAVSSGLAAGSGSATSTGATLTTVGPTGAASGSTASGSTASGATATTPGTTGTTAPGVTTPPSGPDTSPPLITLTSPQRGEFTTQTTIVVEGSVTDQTGVSFFVINRTPVALGAGGTFRHPLVLEQGLNVIELASADPLGNRAQNAISVVSGDFLPETSVVTDAVATRLNRPAFDAIERVAAQQLGGVNLSTTIMAANPLYTGSAGVASVQVDATSASFGTPTLDLDPQVGGLYVKAEIPLVDVTVRAHGRLIGIPYSVTTNVTADVARLEAVASVNVSGGVVTTTLTNVNIDLDNFRFDINNVPGFLENLARNAVRGVIERMVRQQVESIVPAEINKAIAGANGPITQTIMNRQVTLNVIPTAVVFDADGCSVTADADMTLPAPAGMTLPASPGSLRTAGALPTHGTLRAAYLSANDDFLNRIGHAAWRGGLVHLKIDQAFLQRAGLPSWVPVDAFLLQLFFPRLIGLIGPGDPIEIEIGSLTPPMFKTSPAPGLLDMGIGDLSLAIYAAPAGLPRVKILETSLHLSADVAVTVNSNNTLQLRMNGRPLVVTDVHSTLVPMNQTAVENFVDFVLPPVAQFLVGRMSGFPLPTHPALNLRNVDAVRDGPALDFLTIQGDL